jgi:hypothetical protein
VRRLVEPVLEQPPRVEREVQGDPDPLDGDAGDAGRVQQGAPSLVGLARDARDETGHGASW